MKSLTDKRFLLIALISFFTAFLPNTAAGQLSQSNPLHVLNITEGTAKVNEATSKQNKMMDSLIVTKGIIIKEFTKMKEWEKKYNSYLKTARGYAEQLKAGSTLYLEGLTTLKRIMQIQKAIGYNPVGLVATIPMSNIYLETASEFINTFNMLSQAVSKGGREQMLNGAERTELLWNLSGQLQELNQKFKELALSIAFYNLMDVWNTATRGFIDRTHGEIAAQALDRWQRKYAAANAIR